MVCLCRLNIKNHIKEQDILIIESIPYRSIFGNEEKLPFSSFRIALKMHAGERPGGEADLL